MAYIPCPEATDSIATWGSCLKEIAFFNSVEIFAIAIFIMFTLAIWKTRLPGILALPVAFLLVMAMYVSDPEANILALVLFFAVVGFGWVGYSVYRFLKKEG